MTDRVFVNAVGADGSPLTLAVKNGRFANISSEHPATGSAEVIDLEGHLVLPGFVDGHIHLDKSFVGGVSVSHAYGLGDVASDVVDQVAVALAEAGVSIMTNAPGDRAFPPILQLRAAGVRVFTGNDNIQDAWWPYGNGDMLQRAMLVGYRSGFYSDEDLQVALQMATKAGAAVLGKSDYGLAVGNEATFVIVKAPNAAAAVAAAPHERAIVRKGQFWGGPASLQIKSVKVE